MSTTLVKRKKTTVLDEVAIQILAALDEFLTDKFTDVINKTPVKYLSFHIAAIELSATDEPLETNNLDSYEQSSQQNQSANKEEP